LDDPVLNISSCVAAELVVTLKRFPGIDIPLRHLSVSEVASGARSGFCGHVDVTNAYKTKGGHTDPGGQFPWDQWFDKVRWWIGVMEANPDFKADFR
jgi:hypothetical protein